MAIVFAAVVPHSPLLVSSVAKSHHRLSSQTREALNAVMGELYARQLDTLIILTPHGPVLPGNITVSVADQFTGRLTDFGDPRIVVRAPGAVGFSHHCKEVFEDREVPIQLQTFDELDYGSTVPLTFAPAPLPRILPIHVANQPTELLLRLGQALYEASHERTDRIGILASADFVRRTANDTSGRPQPVEKEVSHILTSVDMGRLGRLPDDERVCGLNPIIALTATLASVHTRGTIRSFEVVTRVGLMTATFSING